MVLSDLELDIGKFGFETFMYFDRLCILLWLLEIVRGKFFCIITMPVILLVTSDFFFDIVEVVNLKWEADSLCEVPEVPIQILLIFDFFF